MRKLYILLVFLFICIPKSIAQASDEFDIQYFDGENKFFKFSDVSSDYGLRRLSNDNIYDYHGGIDFAFSNIQGKAIVAKESYIIYEINISSGGLKSITFTDGTSYRHVFLGTSIPTCNSPNVLGGFVLIERSCNSNEYVIINIMDNIAYGSSTGQITYNGQSYPITNTIEAGDRVAPIGNSGGFQTHFHLQKTNNLSNLNDDESTMNPLFDINYLKPENVPYLLETEPLFDNSNFARGLVSHPIKTKVTFDNFDNLPDSTIKYSNTVFDVENIKIQIKPLIGTYSLLGFFEEAFISIGGALNSNPIPSYLVNSSDSNIGSQSQTGIEPFAYSSEGNFDNYYFTEFIPRINNTGDGDAQLSEEALYPDGQYLIRSSLTDIKGNIHNSNEETPIVIDNFYPYIERTLYIYENDELYRIFWERNGDSLVKAGEIGNRTFISGDIIKVVVRTSEPMESMSLSVLDGNEIIIPLTDMIPRTSEDISWEVEFEYTGDTGVKQLEFIGSDKNGTPLLNDIGLVSNHKISTTRLSTPTVGFDRNHKLNDDNSCQITANAGQDVTINEGGEIQLQGSGGSTYSWSPITGLDNPNIFNPVASPSETTIYTLTVTENGCSDTDTVTVIVEGSTNNEPPSNDDCNNAITLNSNTSCSPIFGTVAFATEDGFPNDPSCDLLSNPNAFGVFYTFIAESNTHSIFVDPTGDVLDIVLTVYEGNTCNALEEFDCDDTPNVGSATITNNNFIIGEQYWVRVYDYGTIEPPIGESGFSICVTHPTDSGGDGFDLISSIQSVSNSNPDVGDNITVEYEVSNIGNETNPFAFVSSLYLSTNQNFNENSNIFLGTEGSQPLAPGESNSLTLSVEIPNVEDGQYYIVSIADSVNINDETNEDNNQDSQLIQIGEITEDGPNFDIDHLTVTPNNGLAPSQEVEVSFEIENNGNEDADNFEIAVIFDMNNNGDYDIGLDQVLETISVNDLDAGEENDKNRDIFLPSNIPSIGNYRILFLVDSENEVNETDETDNLFSENINISTLNPAGPDLIMNYVSVEIDATDEIVNENSLCLGIDYRFRFEFENIGSLEANGNGTFIRMRGFISQDQFLDGSDISIGSSTSGSTTIGVGEIDDRSEDFTIEGFSPGDYYLILWADSTEIIDEINESNNFTVVPITISNCDNSDLADLEVIINNISPYESEFGDILNISVTINNIGELAADNFSIKALLSDDNQYDGNYSSDTYNDHRLNGASESNLSIESGGSLTTTLIGFTQNDTGIQPPISNTGIHYIFVKADYFDDINEENKENNISSVPISFTSVDCYFNFDSTEHTQNTYTWEGNSFLQAFAIDTEDECTWNLTSNESWIFVIAPNGIGDDTASFSLSENPNPFSRSGYILLNGEEFYEIIQNGKPCELLADDIKLQLELENTNDIDCGVLGNIDISINQGFPPYTYQWSNGAITQDLESIAEGGIYTVIVTDVSGCNISQSFTVNEGVFIDSTVSENNNIIIANQNNATYQWLDCSNEILPIENEINQSFSPEESGEYAVEITVNDCTVVSECISITCDFSINTSVFEYNYQEGTYTDTVETLTEGNCYWSVSSNNDWITLNNTDYNGTNNIEFVLSENEGPFEREGTIIINDNLEYTFVQSGTPCENLDESDQITISEINQVNIDCFESSGSIDITVENGFPPYTFNWSNGEETEDLTNINISGNYTVIITDTANCTYEESFVITEDLEVDDTITIDGNILISNQSDAIYQWLDCDNGSSPISGAIDQSYTATGTGNYAVEVVYGNCTVISDCVFIDLLSADAIWFSEFKIFPNPTEGLLNIELPKNLVQKEVKYQIYSLEGKLVMNGNIPTQQQLGVIDIEKLSIGNYFLKLSTDTNTWVTQIIKK